MNNKLNVGEEVLVNLTYESYKNLCIMSGSVNMTINELFVKFANDLANAPTVNDEGMYAEKWFENSRFSEKAKRTFLRYLIDNLYFNFVIECWHVVSEIDRKIEVQSESSNKMEISLLKNKKEEILQKLKRLYDDFLKWTKEQNVLSEERFPQKLRRYHQLRRCCKVVNE